MKFRFSTKIVALLGALLLLLVGIAVIAHYSVRSLEQSGELVTHTLDVKQEISDTLIALIDAETGQRGFIIAGETNFLEPYLSGVTNYHSHLEQLRSLTHDNPKQQRLLDEVVPIAAEKLLELKNTVDLRWVSAQAARSAASDREGKALMDQIRRRLGEMSAEEERLLLVRNQELQAAERHALASVTALSALSFGIMVWMTFLIFSEFRRRAQAEHDLAKKNVALMETVGELESYSYSIVHDMRAPLRAMNSFAQILITDYAPHLDEHGRLYLDRISQGAYRLDRLIQDVLRYSALERQELLVEEVRFGDLLQDLIREHPDLRAQRDHIHVSSDCQITFRSNLAILAQIFSNLLRNAVKFVAPDVTPDVKVSCLRRKDVLRFEVQDNGIGIEPEHHAKIFGVFQRLHGPGEYEGTGIGLAIVKKAAERLGGRVGLDSQPGRGSRFWVELPQPFEPVARRPER